jgi:hypothetical protein
VAESGCFASLLCVLCGRWDNAQEDGSYSINADPYLFYHVLCYLRRGLLPIFYDEGKWHDRSIYAALLGEARYFQISRLQKWIEEQQYFSAVKMRLSATEVNRVSLLYETLPTNVDVEFDSCWTTRKVYICPRGIGVHRGHPQACEKASRKFQGEADILYEEESVFRGLMVKKEVVFDTGAFMERPAL